MSQQILEAWITQFWDNLEKTMNSPKQYYFITPLSKLLAELGSTSIYIYFIGRSNSKLNQIIYYLFTSWTSEFNIWLSRQNNPNITFLYALTILHKYTTQHVYNCHQHHNVDHRNMTLTCWNSHTHLSYTTTLCCAARQYCPRTNNQWEASRLSRTVYKLRKFRTVFSTSSTIE